MTNPLDMTLDDLIKQNKKSSRRPSTGEQRASGSTRPIPRWRRNRFHPFAKAPENAKDNNREPIRVPSSVVVPVRAPENGRSSAINRSTKVLISNLDYGVSDDDIKEICSESLIEHPVNYDRSGRSKGTAVVVYASYEDALSTVKKYNNAVLDGKPMILEIVGNHVQAPLPIVSPVVKTLLYSRGSGNRNSNASSSSQGFGGRNSSGGRQFGGRGRGWPEGGNFSGHGSGEGSKGNRNEQVLVSADDLDAELEKYQARGRGRGRTEGGNFSDRGGDGGIKGKRNEPVLVSAEDLDAELEKYQARGRGRGRGRGRS